MSGDSTATLLWIAIPILVLEFVSLAISARPRDRLIQQHEGDIRLPYKRYKQLYPNTHMSYEDYKQMQMRDAYRVTINSKELKRMVR